MEEERKGRKEGKVWICFILGSSKFVNIIFKGEKERKTKSVKAKIRRKEKKKKKKKN